MSHAQDYINALREGSYFKALELANFITEKYEKIKSPIGADQLMQLGGYELSQTDISENDIEAINFLYNYINYHRYLANGEKGYALMTLLSLANLVLVIKEDEDFKAIIDSITIENPTQLEDFLKDTSDFSKLIERNIASTGKWLAAMTEPLTDTALWQKIKEMTNPAFLNFHSDIYRVRKQLVMEGINFFCPLVHNRKQAQTLKETISEFKSHLQHKLAGEGLLQAGDRELVLCIDPTLKQQKLINRYQAIIVLDEQIQEGILKDDDKAVIGMIVEVCNRNEPTWQERQLAQKITDILSLGVKPWYRTFFSKETWFKEKIDGIAQEIELQKL